MSNLGIPDDTDITVENLSGLVMEKVMDAAGKLAGDVIVSGITSAVGDIEGPIHHG